MGSRLADRTSGSRRRTAAWRAACQAILLVVLAGAWPGVASAAIRLPQPAQASPTVAAQRQPTYRALCPPAAPGYVSCLGLLRTDLAPLSRKAVGPSSPPGGFSPSQLRAAYGLPDPSAGNGTGAIVAVVDYSDLSTAAADLAAYRSQFGLSPCTVASGCFTKIDEHGGNNLPESSPDWTPEIALDIEMVSAICPNCRILLIEAASTSVDDLGIAVNTAVSRGAIAVSNSYGGPEFFGQDFYESTYFDHPGVAVTASSGDDGYGVQFPASSPHIVSVGGTSLATAPTPRGWTEAAWTGAGSGCSDLEAKPSWQVDGSCAQRTIADVSVVGDPATGVAMYRGGWLVAGGTSVGSPIIASVFALAGAPTAGTYPASYLYRQSGMLNDVTSGSNGSCGGSYLCTAKPGYDGPTGLGTPNGIGPFMSPLLPGAPSLVSGASGDTTVAVSWHAATANGHPITGYTATASPGGNTCATAGALTCTVSGLTNGTSYTFRVTATNSVGTGPPSAASAGVIPATAPDAPTTLSGTPVDGGAVMSWAAPGSDGGLPITRYTVTSAPLGRTCTTAGGLTCTVLGLVNGTSYTFTVTATNPKGTGPASVASAGITPAPTSGATYVSVTSNRLVDSRSGNGLSSGLTAGVPKSFIVTNRMLGDATKNIPLDAIAITGNLTVTGQTAGGFFTLTTVSTASPTTSTLNFPVGDNRANGVTMPLGTNGTDGLLWITYGASAGATAQVIFDVTGYFVPPPPG